MKPVAVTLASYRRLARWLPFRQLDAQLSALVALAGLMPLLGLLAGLVVPGAPRGTLVLLGALAGTGLALWGLQQLLAPLRMAQAALQLRATQGRVQPLPTDLGGDMGDLLRELRRALEAEAAQGQSLQALSLDDALTGLPNRRFAGEYLRLAVHAAERTGSRLTVALIDPAHIARLNEEHGVDTGDRAIRELGEFLRQWLKRKSDWVGRWEEDQFLAVMFSEQNQATEYLENLKREFARRMQHFDGGPLSLNVGLVELRKHERLQDFSERLETELRLEKHMEPRRPPEADVPGSAKVYSIAGALLRQRH
ncbi:GGDEF domain-containing protein [Solimonas sp. SE-A11]|uniref:GGDEF domain-containing protein n=1 Tax=Solimonas sp. SE-A11 TaxID=3054954 RepID=UPI00259D120F|nr:GGDEF domain-containing protein [Solimonas sp. SE-A11]MDM4770430.1 GGDEF domain-containing protein [Solimonas sp. SE-A11]